jgi:SAM-dependent methyltransferase
MLQDRNMMSDDRDLLGDAAGLAIGSGGNVSPPEVSSPEAASEGQEWRADRYATHARFVADLGAPVLDLLMPRPGERILDLGCGDGALTEQIARAGVDVVGADGAPDMVAAARARGLDARLIDGHALPFVAEFDAVFSNAALHWMTRPGEVVAGVRRALRPGGRFVGEFGGHGNVAAVVVALRAVLGARVPASPWYFPTADEYAERLEAQGFRVDSIALIPRPTPLPTDLGGWLDTFAGSFVSALPANERLAARDAVVALLTPVLRDTRGRWTLDYVRLRFAARLP